jgi:hypothetical protein
MSWDVTPYTDVTEERNASIFRVEKYSKQEAIKLYFYLTTRRHM